MLSSPVVISSLFVTGKQMETAAGVVVEASSSSAAAAAAVTCVVAVDMFPNDCPNERM